MPTYEYKCQSKNCGHTFSLVQSIREYEEKKAACPKCKGKRIKQVPSTFIANTSRKS